jgi:isopenicillin N synthase-like dioxygenase
MRNSEHFFGYNRLGSEFTRGAQDLREQFDFGVDFENDWAPGKPDYLRLWGNAQVRHCPHQRHARGLPVRLHKPHHVLPVARRKRTPRL